MLLAAACAGCATNDEDLGASRTVRASSPTSTDTPTTQTSVPVGPATDLADEMTTTTQAYPTTAAFAVPTRQLELRLNRFPRIQLTAPQAWDNFERYGIRRSAPVTLAGYDGIHFEWPVPSDQNFQTCFNSSFRAWLGAAGPTDTSHLGSTNASGCSTSGKNDPSSCSRPTFPATKKLRERRAKRSWPAWLSPTEDPAPFRGRHHDRSGTQSCWTTTRSPTILTA